MTFGLTSAGYTAPRAADFLTLIRDDFAARLDAAGFPLPDDYDYERDLFIGTITAVMADRLGEQAEAGQATYDQRDPNNATGLQLDNLAIIVGVPRREATFSQATVTLSGTVGTVIVEGKLVEGGGDSGRARWALTADATIGAGGTVDATVRAVESGPVTAAPGDISKIVTPVSGWDSVTNANDATPGQAAETDPELRARRAASLQIRGAANAFSIRGAVLDVDGVTAAVAIENDQRIPATVEGVPLPANSYHVVVYPNTIDNAQRKAVAQAIWEKGPAGILSDGTEVVADVVAADGANKTVRFNFATEVTVNVQTTVTLAPNFALADVEDAVKAIAVDYFLALTVGNAVRELSLSALVATVEGVVGASFLFNGSPNDVEVTIVQIADLGTNTVVEAP